MGRETDRQRIKKPLEDILLRTAKPEEGEHYLADYEDKGDGKGLRQTGLRLRIKPTGTKSWVFRYWYLSVERRSGMGSYPETTLRMARDKVNEFRKQLVAGNDPLIVKAEGVAQAKLKAESTVKAVFEEWAKKKDEKCTPLYCKRLRAGFSNDILRQIGHLPIASIKAPQLLKLLRQIEKRGALEFTQRMRGWLKELFAFAIACGYREGDNPVSHLRGDVLTQPKREGFKTFKTRHDAGEFLRRLEEYRGRPETVIGLRLLMQLASRPGELRQAHWSEFDFAKCLWTVPAERMKIKKDRPNHVVPLSRQSIELLKLLREFTGHGEMLFPGFGKVRDKPVSDMAFNKAIKAVWTEYTTHAHGFRHFLSTHANESGKFRHDVIEAALAHGDPDKIRGTYNKATYLDERKLLAQWWADELDGMQAGGKVLPLTGTDSGPRVRS
jgi:integrase